MSLLYVEAMTLAMPEYICIHMDMQAFSYTTSKLFIQHAVDTFGNV